MKNLINLSLILPHQKKPTRGGISFDKGKITALGSDVSGTGTDCDGLTLMPALCDFSVKLKATPSKAYMQKLTAKAHQGGVWMIGLEAASPDVLSQPEQVEHLSLLTPDCRAIGALSHDFKGENLTDIGRMVRAGATAFTNSPHHPTYPAFMLRALQYSKAFDALVIQRAHDRSLNDCSQATDGEHAMRLGLPVVSTLAETLILGRDLAILKHAGGKYHFGPVTTRESVELIRRAKADGLNVTCDTAPDYALWNDLSLSNYDTKFKLFPPLRGEADRQAVLAAIKDGTIDILCSHHNENLPSTKLEPFFSASAGSEGVQNLLSLALSLHHAHGLTLERMVDAISTAPLRVLGVDWKLAKGFEANFILVDIKKATRIDPNMMSSFAGFMTEGKLNALYIRGEKA